jgi:hypothetical protein
MTDREIAALGPAFAGYLKHYRDCFLQARTAGHFDNYCRGLLSDLPRKSGEPIALACGTAVRTLQEFLATADWRHEAAREKLHRRVAEVLGELPADPVGTVGVIDETSCAKKGDRTPGVQRQYLGCVGKIDNGIVTVHVGVAKGRFLYSTQTPNGSLRFSTGTIDSGGPAVSCSNSSSVRHSNVVCSISPFSSSKNVRFSGPPGFPLYGFGIGNGRMAGMFPSARFLSFSVTRPGADIDTFVTVPSGPSSTDTRHPLPSHSPVTSTVGSSPSNLKGVHDVKRSDIASPSGSNSCPSCPVGLGPATHGPPYLGVGREFLQERDGFCEDAIGAKRCTARRSGKLEFVPDLKAVPRILSHRPSQTGVLPWHTLGR